jgi:hypothetical protein
VFGRGAGSGISAEAGTEKISPINMIMRATHDRLRSGSWNPTAVERINAKGLTFPE